MPSTPIQFSTLLTSLGIQFPLIVVCFLGLVLAFTQLHRRPLAAPLVCVGFGLLLLAAITQPFIQPLVQNLALRSFSRGSSVVNISLAGAGLAFCFNVLRAIAIALIAYAAFLDRPFQAFTVPNPKP